MPDISLLFMSKSYDQMVRIGIIARGKYGRRTVDTILSHSDTEVVLTEVPEHIPEFIEDPAEYVERIHIDPEVFNTDVIITYSLHPDITPQIARMAGRAGVGALIVPGGPSRAPVKELEEISHEYGIFIEVDEICCKLGLNPRTEMFTERFGDPEFEVEIKNGKIYHVDVIKGAPCGSTWVMAEKIGGTPVGEAAAKAGLLIQQYPCRAIRGNLGGIHESAEMHKKEMEDAIYRALD